MNILVTGSSGFVGAALVNKLRDDKFPVSAVTRNPKNWSRIADVNSIEIGNLTSSLDWTNALKKIDVIVHLAARTHILKDKSKNPLSDYRYINVDCSLNLARQAAAAGVKRFIYISSIKVNGEFSKLGKPFTADQIPMPSDPYGVSKYEAEIVLEALSKETGMEVVIIRPPLIYGPGVKANFLAMMKWVSRGITLPLGGITNNRRSFIFLDNLISLIITCINHPAAANQIFLASDDEDLSTTELINHMALALGCASNLISIPPYLVNLMAKLFGRADIAERLTGCLQVDIKKTKDLLGWVPLVSVEEAMHQTAKYFLKSKA